MSYPTRPRNQPYRNPQRGQPFLLPLNRPLHNPDPEAPRKDDYAAKWQAWVAAVRQPGDTLFYTKIFGPEEPTTTNKDLYCPGTYVLPFLSTEREISRYHKQFRRYGRVIEEIHRIVPVYHGESTVNDGKEWLSGINERGRRTATSDRLRIYKYPTNNSIFFTSAPRIRVFRDSQDVKLYVSSTSRQIQYPPFAQYAAGALRPKETREINRRVYSMNDPLSDLIADELEKDKRFASPRNLF